VTRLLAPALLLALAACNSGLEPQYRVTDLRILAVRAQVPGSSACASTSATCADVDPDDTVVLETLVANPQRRPGLAVRWYACAPSATDAVASCIDDAVLADPEKIATAPGVVQIPVASGTGERISVPLSLLRQQGQPDPLQAALDAVKARADRQPTYQCLMFVEVPLVVIATAGGKRDVALRRVRLVPRPADVVAPYDGYDVNANPTIRGLASGAKTLDADCTGGTSIGRASFPAGRIELCGSHDGPPEYRVCDAAGNRTRLREAYGWQWYVTAGEFPDESGVGNATDDHPDFERPAGGFTLWAILRDGRGGEDWLTLEVDPP